MSLLPELGSIPSAKNFEAVLEFMPVLERLMPNQVVRWQGGERKEDGSITLGFPVYEPNVEGFIKSLYDHGFIQRFNWSDWQSEAYRYVENPELVLSADLETCIKLLTTHIRKERFCEGHLADMLSSGHIRGVLRRIRQLHIARQSAQNSNSPS